MTKVTDKLSSVYRDVLSLTSHGATTIESDSRRIVLKILDKLKPAIDEVVHSPPASAESVAQFVVMSLQAYPFSKENADTMIKDVELFIRQELHPTQHELNQAYRELKIERRKWDGSPSDSPPSLQQIRDAVKEARRDTLLLKKVIQNIHHVMDGNRPYGFGVAAFVGTDTELLAAIANTPEPDMLLMEQEEEGE
jgi:hypothetical protein